METFIETLGAAGLDRVVPFPVGLYQRGIEPEWRLPAVSEAWPALVIGNTRALWPIFLRNADLDAPDPLDRYVEGVVGAAARRYLGRSARIWYAPEPPPRRLPFQRLAELAGLAQLGPAHLLVHPRFGPWISLRALVVWDGPPVAAPAPLPALSGDWRADVQRAFEAAVTAAGGAPTQHDVVRSWRDWVAVRDACPIGAEHRFSEAQLRYHYTHDRAALR